MLRLLLITFCLAVPSFSISLTDLPLECCGNVQNIAQQAPPPPPPATISIPNNGDSSLEKNEKFHLRLSGGGGGAFSGFVIQAQDPNGAPVGKFNIIEENISKTVACRNQDDTITHTEAPKESPIDSVDFSWVPVGYQGNVRFIATVAKEGGQWARRVLKEINV